MKFNQSVLILSLITMMFYPTVQSQELNEEQQKQIKLLREELEFLATKLLRITGEVEYTTTHEGHEMVIFGTCGTATDTGLLISCVSPDSTAEKMGLRTGDKLLSINGMQLVDVSKALAYERYANTLKGIKAGDKVSVKFIQNGKVKQAAQKVEAFYSPTYSFSVSAKRD